MKQILFEKLRTNVKISFYSSYYDSGLVSACQKLKPLAKYDGKGAWYVLLPLNSNDDYLEDIGTYKDILSYFDINESSKLIDFLKKKNEKNYKLREEKEKLKKDYLVKFNDEIKRYPILYKHQIEGVKFLLEKYIDGNGAILGWEMGTGKSKTSIVFCEIQNFNKILIVCPASLKYNWEREIKMVNEYSNTCILPQNIPDKNTKYFIINYDMLIREFDFEKDGNKVILTLHEDSFLKNNFDVMLLDESHLVKSPNSKRSKAVLELMNNINFIIPISGTPLKNKTKDIFNLLKLVRHPLGNNFFNFGLKFCGGYKSPFGWNFGGSSNLIELNEKLKEVMTRIKKEECLDLPEKIINEIYIDLPEEFEREYNNAFQDYLTFVREVKLANKEEREKDNKIQSIIQAEELVKLNLLKQICSKSKFDMLKERIDDILEEDSERKIVIFSQYNEIINLLFDKYKKIAVKLTGSTTQLNRQKNVDDFQNDNKVRLFISNILAGGVGITLTKSDTVIIIDFPWTPSDLSQAIDRTHRIGQKNNVNVFYFITKDTIEEEIYKLLKKKSGIINKAIDGIDLENVREKSNVFSELTANLKSKFI